MTQNGNLARQAAGFCQKNTGQALCRKMRNLITRSSRLAGVSQLNIRFAENVSPARGGC
tara:strand:+ start:268 stop:444 length:177 start_codon:yes stop_codon:yes gene_type:complete